MSEIKRPVVSTTQIDYQCDSCKLANVVYSESGFPGKYTHTCPTCKVSVILKEPYPKVVYTTA